MDNLKECKVLGLRGTDMQRERERVLEWGFCGKDRQREARNLNAGVCGQGMPRANLKGGGGVRTVSRWPLSVVTLLHRTVAERHSRAASGTCCTARDTRSKTRRHMPKHQKHTATRTRADRCPLAMSQPIT